MAKLKCHCGNILSNVSDTNEVEGLLIRVADIGYSEVLSSLKLSDIGRDVWECPECGRLAISYPDIGDVKVKWYTAENGIPGGLMRNKKATRIIDEGFIPSAELKLKR